MIHYLLIRRDLPFGVTLAQLAHAAANSMEEWIKEESFVDDDAHYIDFPATYGGMTVVVLGVRDRVALKNWEMRLKRKKIPMTTVHEPDEPWNGQLMAIGIWPGYRHSLERH